MLSENVFRDKWTTLGYLPTRDGSDPEEAGRYRTYYRAILAAKLEERDFIEACDRLLFSEQWFPTIARIIEAVDECAKERRIRQQPAIPTGPTAPLVCGTCHGARWVRLGGYDPGGLPTGKDGKVIHSPQSRMQHCPHCTTDGMFDARKEYVSIMDRGGVPDPAWQKTVDMSAITWPAKMAALRGPDGKIDKDKLYRLSREQRGLDPDVDERKGNIGRTAWEAIPR